METTITDQGASASKNGDGRVSRTVLIVSVLVALAVAGAVGIGIGWKVEQNRVKDDVADIRPVGKVTAVNGDSLTVALKTAGGTRTYVVTDSTRVDVAKGGSNDDVVEGSLVLVKNHRNDDGKLEASEIVVLPGSTSLGSR